MDHIKEIINSTHNPSLINVKEAPNENTIYHIYSDGEITSQKGSWAYGQRSEFTSYYPLDKFIPVDYFPIVRTNSNGIKFGYAIVTYHDALKIRELIKNS
jgi:hypothetical protein